MSLPKIKENIKDLDQDVRGYLNAKYEYLELQILKKAAKTFTDLLKILSIGFFAVIVVTLLSFAVAFLIGDRLGSISAGFFVVAGFYLFIMLVILFFGKKIFRSGIIRLLSTEFSAFKKALFEFLKF